MTSPYRLIGSACLRATVVLGVAVALARIPFAGSGDPDAARRAVLLTGVGAAIGCAAAGLQIHPRRSVGLVPLTATGLFLILLSAALSDASWSWGFCLLLGLFAGAAGPALRAIVQASVPTRLPTTPIDAAGAVVALLPVVAVEIGLLAPHGWWRGVLAATCAVAAVAAWIFLPVPTLEMFVEWALRPLYRLRTRGPGANRIPRRGPLLIVANHASYADPFLLCDLAPRKVTPLMTSFFFDRPGIHWLMVHVVGAIRVQASAFRREAPELREAAAVLRRGGCVLLFPEGGLRKREETLLGPFGQGVWHILKEAPQTPVVVCWIEGTWGSFASYRGGPPLTNKPFDWRRPIDVAVAEARVLDPAILADHRTTRAYLRNACLECRRWLGLPVPEESAKKEGADDEPEEEAPQADARPINP